MVLLGRGNPIRLNGKRYYSHVWVHDRVYGYQIGPEHTDLEYLGTLVDVASRAIVDPRYRRRLRLARQGVQQARSATIASSPLRRRTCESRGLPSASYEAGS
jgi:hypothetical protein